MGGTGSGAKPSAVGVKMLILCLLSDTKKNPGGLGVNTKSCEDRVSLVIFTQEGDAQVDYCCAKETVSI